MGAEDQKNRGMDDSVDTLSLCDLPMYGDDDDDDYRRWADFSSDDQISSSDEDLFEFFSGDLSASAWPAAENIVFCGKLIPYKNLPVLTDSEKLEDSTVKKEQQIEKRGFLGLKPFKKGKKFRSKSIDDGHGKAQKLQEQAPGSKSFPGTRGSAAAEKYDFTYPPSPHKFHWHVFFGPARMPAEMKLRDIKNRQNRLPSQEERKKGGGGKRSGKKLWGLLKVLGCGISHANTMAKASLTLRWVEME